MSVRPAFNDWHLFKVNNATTYVDDESFYLTTAQLHDAHFIRDSHWVGTTPHLDAESHIMFDANHRKQPFQPQRAQTVYRVGDGFTAASPFILNKNEEASFGIASHSEIITSYNNPQPFSTHVRGAFECSGLVINAEYIQEILVFTPFVGRAELNVAPLSQPFGSIAYIKNYQAIPWQNFNIEFNLNTNGLEFHVVADYDQTIITEPGNDFLIGEAQFGIASGVTVADHYNLHNTQFSQFSYSNSSMIWDENLQVFSPQG